MNPIAHVWHSHTSYETKDQQEIVSFYDICMFKTPFKGKLGFLLKIRELFVHTAWLKTSFVTDFEAGNYDIRSVTILKPSESSDILTLDPNPLIYKMKTKGATKLCIEPGLLIKSVQCLLNNGIIKETDTGYMLHHSGKPASCQTELRFASIAHGQKSRTQRPRNGSGFLH